MKHPERKLLFYIHIYIYKRLYEGEPFEFDLTNQGTKIVCRSNKDHASSNVTEFTRTTNIIRNLEDTIFIN